MGVKRNVKTVKVSMQCDKCKTGIMERDGNTVLTTYPPQYPHKCNNCGHVENYTVEYPYLDVEPIEEDIEELDDDWEPDVNDAVKTIARHLFECVEDLKDLGDRKSVV